MNKLKKLWLVSVFGLVPGTSAFSQKSPCRTWNKLVDVRTDVVKRLASGGFAALLSTTTFTHNVNAATPLIDQGEAQGIPLVTQSDLGQSIRSSIVRGAQVVDKLDLQWERLSDGLRDQKKCDPVTNRRLFDNGVRKDGSKIGNPVLGALCTPEPLNKLDLTLVSTILDLEEEAAVDTLRVDGVTLTKRQQEVETLLRPAFARAESSTPQDDEQSIRRQAFNRDLYARTRTYGEFIQSREIARKLERAWGDRMLQTLAPNANRENFRSPFPKPDEEDTQPYDEGALLDALGALSVALNKLQEGGLIGHWEISIPEDDYWNVVTVAVDDDISIDGQILGRERNQPLSGSEIVSLVRSAMETRAQITYKLNTFFIDPTTTRQELYSPSQLLVSLSDLGQ